MIKYIQKYQLGKNLEAKQSSIRVAPNIDTSNAAMWKAEKIKDYKDLLDLDFREKYGESKHKYRYDNDPEYRKSANQRIQASKSKITLPSTDVRMTAPPNSAWMYPNLRGKQGANMARFSNAVIEAAIPLPIPAGVSKVFPIIKNSEFVRDAKTALEYADAGAGKKIEALLGNTVMPKSLAKQTNKYLNKGLGIKKLKTPLEITPGRPFGMQQDPSFIVKVGGEETGSIRLIPTANLRKLSDIIKKKPLEMKYGFEGASKRGFSLNYNFPFNKKDAFLEAYKGQGINAEITEGLRKASNKKGLGFYSSSVNKTDDTMDFYRRANEKGTVTKVSPSRDHNNLPILEGNYLWRYGNYKGTERIPKINIKNLNKRKAFKSEINWGNWNKEIPSNKPLMDEYLQIEKTAKQNGTWMKNPDGTDFPGTPEQFVQQNSSNFKNAFGNTKILVNGRPQILTHNSPDTFSEFSLNKVNNGRLSGDGVYTFEEGALWKGIPEYLKRTVRYPAKIDQSKYGKIEYHLYGNSTNPKIGKGQFDDITKDIVIDSPTSTRVIDDINRKNIHVFPNTNQLKSAIGNNGMFDMTNPNIYKGLIPAIVGARTVSQNNKVQKQ